MNRLTHHVTDLCGHLEQVSGTALEKTAKSEHPVNRGHFHVRIQLEVHLVEYARKQQTAVDTYVIPVNRVHCQMFAVRGHKLHD